MAEKETDSFEHSQEDYMQALRQYYKLKQTYEKYYREKKRKIKNRDISLQEKKNLLRKFKMPCINCRKKGGTIFTNDNGILKAICGVAQSPCSLDIEIKKADWRYLPTVIENVKGIAHKIKKQIIETKLNFLFGLESEDITIKAFEKLKTEFDSAYALLVDLEERLQVNYAEKQRAEEIEQYKLQLYLANEEFSAAIEGYRAAQNAALLSDAIEIYIDKILELQKLIQETKYAEIYVDKEKKNGVLILDREPPDKYVLKAFPLGILQNEEEWEPGTIIRNLK